MSAAGRVPGFFETASRWHIVRGSLQISVVVGLILNLINQGRSVMGGQPVAWANVALNFLVPYCVATFSATRNERRRAEESA